MTRSGLAAVIGLTVLLLIGCGEDEAAGPPPTGSIEVSLSMTGSVPDADGFVVTIDDGDGDTLLSGGSLRVSGLAAGGHTVTISDVAPNCDVADGTSRDITVTANETTHVAFAVECPGLGSLEVFTDGAAGAGIPDPDGYTVTLNGNGNRAIGIRDAVTFAELAAGQYEVELTGVADNCTAIDNPRVINVTEGETPSVFFGVACPPFFDHIAFSGSQDGFRGLFVMRSDGSGPANLTGPDASGSYPAWSPDATTIVYTRDSGLHAIDLETGDVFQLVESVIVGLASWSPDGSRLVYDRYSDAAQTDAWGDLYVINADGTNPINLTPGPERGFDPAWSPAGDRIAFGKHHSDESGIWLIDADGSNLIQIAADSLCRLGCQFPAWSPDGMRIAFEACPDLFVNCGSIHVMNADGSGVVRLTPGHDGREGYHAARPTWSPDGSRIAFYRSHSSPGNAYEVFVMGDDGSNPVSLTPGMNATNPAWSPGQP